MIQGIGIDMIALERIKKYSDPGSKLARRVLTAEEQLSFRQLAYRRRIEFLAGRFAAKEAYAKAKGTGIGQRLSWQDINVSSSTAGEPVMTAQGEAHRIHVSLSHTKAYAMAQVIVEQYA